MTLRPLDPAKAGEGIAAPRSFLQTPFWAAFKAAHGWLPLCFAVDSSSEGAPETPLTVLVRRVAGPFSIAYVPMGPDPEAFRARKANADPGAEGAFLGELARALAPHLPRVPFASASTHRSRFRTRFRAGATMSPRRRFPLDRPCAPDAPARKAPIDVQPPDTVIVDLTRSEDDILAGMRSKWRYNARLAERKGVRVACLSGEEARTRGVETFWNLYTQTAERDGIALHARAYYEDLLARAASYAPTPLDPPISVRVYLAEHEGRALASIITIFAGEEAVYLYGASSNEKRN
jgi:lipid II:glycine glycyltransferase (peptidoglycan interpeptide bridge formation enzyme)